MARLQAAYYYSQTQIDEYINRGLANFMGVGGNNPWGEFIKKYGANVDYFIDVPINERFYLASQPYAWCKGISTEYGYDKPVFSEQDCAPITGINLISLSTHKTLRLDVRRLLTKGRFYDGVVYSPKGTINTYVFELIRKAIPYITLREVLQGLVQFIGNKHIYFEEERAHGRICREGYSGQIPCTIRILNGYFAENVCYSSR